MPKLGLGLGLGPRNNKQYLSFDEKNRIIYDGGIVRNLKALEDTLKFFNTLMPNTKLLYCPELGIKLRTSGANNYVTKLYDISSNMLDGSQTTALNQPYLSGNIAPNEKYAIKNPNGGSAYLTHTPISFNATDKWSVSTMININSNSQVLTGALPGYVAYCGKYLYESLGLVDSFYSILSNNATQRTTSTYKFNKFGKNIVITWVALGNGTVQIHENGKLVDTLMNVNSSFLFSEIFRGRSMNIHGEIKYHSIRGIALTQQQVQDEYNYLRSLFPEIESVQIGTQTWATSNCEITCTPQGNAIPEMQAAANVEKVVNGGFDSNTANWVSSSDGKIGWNNGKLNISVITPDAAGVAHQQLSVTIGKYYKYSVNSFAKSASNKLYIGTVLGLGDIVSHENFDGNKSGYFLAGSTTVVIQLWTIGTGSNVDWDSVSIEEVGWSDSKNLYNAVYANTEGTVEQKEYAAVKAAAMWCYPGNDPAKGAIYGKLYNWYAVKLLQMDIDYYNAANPTTPWGWRVPTSADFTLLYAYLGGNLVAGGKMKKEGTDYWSAPNTGADNLSGFSAIPSGYRTGNAVFSGFKSLYLFTTLNKVQYYLSKDVESIYTGSVIEIEGTPIRLIKA